ncbi:MAG TPA: formyltransferase family protein, partial [Candidatus Gracilibacteria bacterium]|nr:formyltransferase family protein [Candidatus Gracilibacteria bacterium]
MFRIGVLASTKGTDLQAIMDEMKAGKMTGVELAVVLSNKEKAYVLERARSQGYTAIFVDPKGKTKEEYDEELARLLKENSVD